MFVELFAEATGSPSCAFSGSVLRQLPPFQIRKQRLRKENKIVQGYRKAVRLGFEPQPVGLNTSSEKMGKGSCLLLASGTGREEQSWARCVTSQALLHPRVSRVLFLHLALFFSGLSYLQGLDSLQGAQSREQRRPI